MSKQKKIIIKRKSSPNAKTAGNLKKHFGKSKNWD